MSRVAATDNLTALPLANRLEAHVRALAEDIGERNIYHESALSDAADYIERQWRTMGYEVIRQTYELEGVPSSNLEITHFGTRHTDEIFLIGAHYDSVIGSSGANDSGSGVKEGEHWCLRFRQAGSKPGVFLSLLSLR